MHDKTYGDRMPNIAILLDFYGEMLSDRQREATELFYNNDYSLSEISELTGITRQGVRDRIVKSEKILYGLEEKLHLAERFGNIKQETAVILKELERISESTGADVAYAVSQVKRLGEL